MVEEVGADDAGCRFTLSSQVSDFVSVKEVPGALNDPCSEIVVVRQLEKDGGQNTVQRVAALRNLPRALFPAELKLLVHLSTLN